ncbi:hypothetical protein K438DRAFT_1989907 [Mycena galopus ATCC 62051]|nr:hypothetical protein K438DRAFT_1989907 [Mycena galopus ATCC 62051]
MTQAKNKPKEKTGHDTTKKAKTKKKTEPQGGPAADSQQFGALTQMILANKENVEGLGGTSATGRPQRTIRSTLDRLTRNSEEITNNPPPKKVTNMPEDEPENGQAPQGKKKRKIPSNEGPLPPDPPLRGKPSAHEETDASEPDEIPLKKRKLQRGDDKHKSGSSPVREQDISSKASSTFVDTSKVWISSKVCVSSWTACVPSWTACVPSWTVHVLSCEISIPTQKHDLTVHPQEDVNMSDASTDRENDEAADSDQDGQDLEDADDQDFSEVPHVKPARKKKVSLPESSDEEMEDNLEDEGDNRKRDGDNDRGRGDNDHGRDNDKPARKTKVFLPESSDEEIQDNLEDEDDNRKRDGDNDRGRGDNDRRDNDRRRGEKDDRGRGDNDRRHGEKDDRERGDNDRGRGEKDDRGRGDNDRGRGEKDDRGRGEKDDRGRGDNDRRRGDKDRQRDKDHGTGRKQGSGGGGRVKAVKGGGGSHKGSDKAQSQYRSERQTQEGKVATSSTPLSTNCSSAKQGSFDVLDKHRSGNKAKKPPSVHRLAETKKKQEGKDSGEDDEADEDSDGEGANASKDRKRRTARDGGPSATQEGFYPPEWLKIIGRAKDSTFVHLLDKDLFPDKDTCLRHIRGELCEEIIYREKEIKELRLEVVLPQKYWEDHSDDMAELVWAFVSTFRSRCYDCARDIVTGVYSAQMSLELEEADDPERGFSQDEYRQKSEVKVKALLNKLAFMHDCKSDGTRTDFGSRGILLLGEFILTMGKRPLCELYPDTFREWSTHFVVALSILLRCAITEYETGIYAKKEFTKKANQPYYLKGLVLCDKLQNLPVRWERSRKQWNTWARQIRLRHPTTNEVQPAKDDEMDLAESEEEAEVDEARVEVNAAGPANYGHYTKTTGQLQTLHQNYRPTTGATQKLQANYRRYTETTHQLHANYTPTTRAT